MLSRAVVSCTDLKDFHREYTFIYSSCLLNRYPLAFIEHSIQQFFLQYNPTKTNFQYNKLEYRNFRQCILTTNPMAWSSSPSSYSSSHMRMKRLLQDNEHASSNSIKRVKK